MIGLFHRAKKSRNVSGDIEPKDMFVPIYDGVQCLYCGNWVRFCDPLIEEELNDPGCRPFVLVRDISVCDDCGAWLQSDQYCDLEDRTSNLISKIDLVNRNRRLTNKKKKPWYKPEILERSPYILEEYSPVSFVVDPKFETPYENYCYLHESSGDYCDQDYIESYMPMELIYSEEGWCPGDRTRPKLYTDHPMWRETTFYPEDIDTSLLNKIEVITVQDKKSKGLFARIRKIKSH